MQKWPWVLRCSSNAHRSSTRTSSSPSTLRQQQRAASTIAAAPAVVVTRFAPSPTGSLHIGGLRTALYNYLFAKQHQQRQLQQLQQPATAATTAAAAAAGLFLLRIEDTDRKRYVAGSVQQLMATLAATGLVHDNNGSSSSCCSGSSNSNHHQLVVQSERLPLYQQRIQQLLHSRDAYACFCTTERLDQLRQQQQQQSLPSVYDRLCSSIPYEEMKQKMKDCEAAAATATATAAAVATSATAAIATTIETAAVAAAANYGYVIRMRVPNSNNNRSNSSSSNSVVVRDMIRGKIAFPLKTIDDQVLIKSDGYPTYHFAVVVDDAAAGVTHVIRGEEWLTSTPKHVLLYNMLQQQQQQPLYLHLPLLLNADGSKLSKRNSDVAADAYLQQGYLPAALINFVALLGWSGVNVSNNRQTAATTTTDAVTGITTTTAAAPVVNSNSNKEIFTLTELLQYFDVKRVQKAGAVVNIEKLKWINQQHIRLMLNRTAVPATTTTATTTATATEESAATLDGGSIDSGVTQMAKLLKSQLLAAYDSSNINNSNNVNTVHNSDYVERVLLCMKEHVTLTTDFVTDSQYFFASPSFSTAAAVQMRADVKKPMAVTMTGIAAELTEATAAVTVAATQPQRIAVAVADALEQSSDADVSDSIFVAALMSRVQKEMLRPHSSSNGNIISISAAVMDTATAISAVLSKNEASYRNKQYYMCVRYALTAQPSGPHLNTIIATMGREMTVSRLKHAATLLM